MARQLLEYHPRFGFRFIPGIKARVPHENGGYLVRVNNLGFRCNHDFVNEKREGTFRILLFGDSFTAGDAVSNEYRYGDLIEKEAPDWEVYNFGLPGTGTDQQYLVYEEHAADIEHDVLIIAQLVENIRRVASRYRIYLNDRGEEVCYGKPYYELEGDELALRQVPPPKDPIPVSGLPSDQQPFLDRGGRFAAIRKVVGGIGLKEVAQKLTKYQPLPEYDHPDKPDWRLMRAILERWIQNHPTPVILMPIPLYQYIEETSNPAQYQARFRELADDTGCLLHDPLPDLLQYPLKERRRFRFRNDVHLTKEGHAALAASLGPVLRNILVPQKQ